MVKEFLTAVFIISLASLVFISCGDKTYDIPPQEPHFSASVDSIIFDTIDKYKDTIIIYSLDAGNLVTFDIDFNGIEKWFDARIIYPDENTRSLTWLTETFFEIVIEDSVRELWPEDTIKAEIIFHADILPDITIPVLRLPETDTTVINASMDLIESGPEGKTVDVTIEYADGVELVIKSDVKWITHENKTRKSTGRRDGDGQTRAISLLKNKLIIEVTVEPNDTDKERTGTLTISDKNTPAVEFIIEVEQEAGETQDED